MDRPQNKRRALLICAALASVTLAVFLPVAQHDFITYDDGIYITQNPHVVSGLTWDNVAWAFRTRHGGNWHPLTWLSHCLDAQLFGLRPGWHHFHSALLHALNAVLLFLLLQELTAAVWRSAFVAALFALHPLHVESVAWAAERKDVLSAGFGLFCLWAYARHARTPRGLRWYLVSLISFALGLMSKPMLVTLPFVMLLLDYWPLRRFSPEQPSDGSLQTSGALNKQQLRSLLAEKLPFFALSVASCASTLWAQSSEGAVVPISVLPFAQRFQNALVVCLTYLAKTIWPAHLALFYPMQTESSMARGLGAGSILLGLLAWVLWRAKTRPHLVAGWLWYLGMLVPVIGLVQVGMQQMADRYTYLPLIGIFLMVTWELADRWPLWRLPKPVLCLSAGAALAACATMTFVQLGYWTDTEAVFGHSLTVTPNNYVALYNHGMALFKKGRLEEASADYERAIRLAPNLDAARDGLGEVLAQQGRFDEAIDQFSKVLELQPTNVPAWLHLGMARARQGKLDAAASAFSAALQLNPNDAGAHNNLGNTLTLQGKHEEAFAHFAEAVRLQPGNASAHNNFAIACKRLGRTGDAIEQYREALRLKPDSLEALNNLAWTLATCPEPKHRNGAEALELATRACEMTRYQHPTPLATLAAAYAELGRFPEGLAFIERAQQCSGAAQTGVASRLGALAEALRAGQPYHGN